jgi:twitching motility protein PilI
MAKRQALRELQQRIAELLQQAENQQGPAASWLGVRLGEQRLLLPLQQSGEIHALGAIQPLPYAKPWFLGVTALRGNVYGVVDLSAFLPQAPAAASPAERSPQRLVAFNDALGLNVVLRVDGLEGLRGHDAFVRSEAAAPGALAHWGPVFFDNNGTAWREISLLALAQDPQFLDIAAQMAPTGQALSP